MRVRALYGKLSKTAATWLGEGIEAMDELTLPAASERMRRRGGG